MTASDKTSKPQYLVLGQIQRPHGVRGEVRMSIMTDYPERITQLETVYLGKNPNDRLRPFTPTRIRFHKNYVLLTFEEIPDRTAADPLRGLLVMVDIANAVPLEEGEYYLFELIGMQVVTEDGTTLGPIREVLETGANDVYIVAHPQHGDVLLPAHSETVIDINFDTNTVTMRLPDGLLPSV